MGDSSQLTPLSTVCKASMETAISSPEKSVNKEVQLKKGNQLNLLSVHKEV